MEEDEEELPKAPTRRKAPTATKTRGKKQALVSVCSSEVWTEQLLNLPLQFDDSADDVMLVSSESEERGAEDDDDDDRGGRRKPPPRKAPGRSAATRGTAGGTKTTAPKRTTTRATKAAPASSQSSRQTQLTYVSILFSVIHGVTSGRICMFGMCERRCGQAAGRRYQATQPSAQVAWTPSSPLCLLNVSTELTEMFRLTYTVSRRAGVQNW